MKPQVIYAINNRLVLIAYDLYMNFPTTKNIVENLLEGKKVLLVPQKIYLEYEI